MHRLLQLDTCIGVGSTGRIAETIARHAKARGWECYMAHGARYVGKSDMASYQVSSKACEIVHYAKSILFDAHGLGSSKATRRFVKWIKQLSPDIIHLHTIHGYWLNYQVLFNYLRESGIPVVWTFHDCWAITGHCATFPLTPCNKWKEGCHGCPSIRVYPRSLFVDNSNSNYNRKKKLFSSVPNLTVVSVSNWLDGIVGQSFMSSCPHIVIPNGVNLDVFYPRADSVTRVRGKYGLEDKFVILSVADRWTEEIGFSDISRLRSLLDDRFIIVLVGVTPDQRESLPEGVVGILHTNSRDELAELYSAADISFTPQSIATFGLVSAESMACGTPAVVYAPAAAEVVDKYGFVVPARDLVKLAETIRLFSENNLKKELSSLCVRRVKKEYDETANINRYVDLYESLISVV